tara:strand:+ start:157 stop:348 length:192 start_codon:yes stop_codon:yes gene_type:complete
MMVRIIGRWNRELKRLEGKTKHHPEYVPLEELATKYCDECERELDAEWTRCWHCENKHGREVG